MDSWRHSKATTYQKYESKRLYAFLARTGSLYVTIRFYSHSRLEPHCQYNQKQLTQILQLALLTYHFTCMNSSLKYIQSWEWILQIEGSKTFKTILWTISGLWNSRHSHKWESNHAAGSFLAHIQSGRNKAGVIKMELIEQCNGNNSPPKQAQLNSKQWQKVSATSATKKLTPQSAKLRKGLSAILVHSFFRFNCTLKLWRFVCLFKFSI